MILRINWQNLRTSHEGPLLALDVLMLWLVSINLAWYCFDVLFGVPVVQAVLMDLVPGLARFYARVVHPNFVLFDLAFVAIFVGEVMLRWGIAIYRRTYHRWFFYPFAHWYDVLGSIPIGGLRLLRLIRLVSVIYRLHKYRIIDFRESWLLRTLETYYRIVMEEVSDRVVLNVLESVQREVRSGGVTTGRLTEQVIRPRRDVVVPWLAERVSVALQVAIEPNREPIGHYIRAAVRNGLKSSSEVGQLAAVPVLGPQIEQRLERAISEIVHAVVMQLAADLDGVNDEHFLQQLSGILFDSLLEPHPAMNEAMRDTLLDAIELIKAQVAVQQWKEQAG